jgi:hypothetical protein
VIAQTLKHVDDKKYPQVGIPENLINTTIDKKAQVEGLVNSVEQYVNARAN